MVQYKTILKAIDEYLAKCLTIAEIKERLNNYSDIEKEELLLGSKSSLLNDGEIDYYRYLSERLNSLYDAMAMHQRLYDETKEGSKGGKFWKTQIDGDMELIGACEKELFNFERRIVENYNPKTRTIEYDESDYALEEQKNALDEEIRELEQAQIDSQKDVVLSDDNISSLQHYYGSGAKYINSRLNKGETWRNMSAKDKDMMKSRLDRAEKNISEAINKTKGLVQNTTVFHGGRFDVSKVVGDKIKFNGFTSCSFQEDVGDVFKQDASNQIPKPLQYNYKILLPTGYKGLCANDSNYQLTNWKREHEYLLDKGAEFDIVDIDYKNHMVTLMPSE